MGKLSWPGDLLRSVAIPAVVSAAVSLIVRVGYGHYDQACRPFENGVIAVGMTVEDGRGRHRACWPTLGQVSPGEPRDPPGVNRFVPGRKDYSDVKSGARSVVAASSGENATISRPRTLQQSARGTTYRYPPAKFVYVLFDDDDRVMSFYICLS